MSHGPEMKPRWPHGHSSRILNAGVVLGLLYFGRHVLIPIALAIMVSLLLAPLVRTLRRIGIGRAASVLIVVLTLTVSCLGVAVALGTQALRIAGSLSQYEATIHRKLRTLDEVALGRVRVLTSEANGILTFRDSEPSSRSADQTSYYEPELSSAAREARTAGQPFHLIGRLLTTVWGPLQTTGIVLLVVIVVLLEHESLRDRIIRIAGTTDIRAMTLALNDAGERLSRYFVSQACVNLAFGVVIWTGLGILGVPQAMLWGVLASIMRFVPYVGVATAALFATALAFAVDPGWSLALSTLALFIALDIVAAQLLEPRLYGHATGLSPFSVVVAAIFWSALWGPVGLILSTPLTLCFLVAGRHVKALGTLELLLGDAQPLTLAQRFYQRALAGDPHEIVANARAFLKNHSLARYCDRVLLPALHLAQLDAEHRTTGEHQHPRIRRVIIRVVTALDPTSLGLQRRQLRGTVLDEIGAGRWLRQQRETLTGKWQGPLSVPAGSVVVCLGVDSSADDLGAELLVRLLRTERLDARHFSPGELGKGLPPGADPDGVSIVFMVSAFPSSQRERCEFLSHQARELFPRAQLVRVSCPGITAASGERSTNASAEPAMTSLEQAVELGICRQRKGDSQDEFETAALTGLTGMRAS